jgi:hypothetical protein
MGLPFVPQPQAFADEGVQKKRKAGFGPAFPSSSLFSLDLEVRLSRPVG